MSVTEMVTVDMKFFLLGDLFLHSDIVVIFACKSMLTDFIVPFSSCRT